MTAKDELEAARRRIIVLEYELEQLRKRTEQDGAAKEYQDRNEYDG